MPKAGVMQIPGRQGCEAWNMRMCGKDGRNEGMLSWMWLAAISARSFQTCETSLNSEDCGRKGGKFQWVTGGALCTYRGACSKAGDSSHPAPQATKQEDIILIGYNS